MDRAWPWAMFARRNFRSESSELCAFFSPILRHRKEEDAPSLHGGGFCGLPPSLHHPNDEDLSLGTPEKVARMGHRRSVSACGVPSPVRQEKPCRTWGTRRQDMMMGSHETVLGFWTAARHSGSCRGADPPRPKAVGLC